MKNLTNSLIAISLCFSAFSSFGQGIQSEIGLNDSYLQNIQQVANKGEFVYTLVEYDFHSLYLEKYDSLGNRIQKVNVAPDFGFSTFQSNRMVITNDGNIWISGVGLEACDIPMVYQHVVVYDSDCQFLNGFTKILGSVQSTQNYRALSAITDTSVAVNYQNQDSSWVEVLSPSTQTILANVNTPSLFGFGRNNQFHVLGHTISKIYGMDSQGVLTDSISLPSPFREIGTWNDTIIALGYNELYKITPDLLTYTTHPIPNLSNFTRLKIDNQGVRFSSSNFNKAVHYLDHALNIQSLMVVPVFSPNNTIHDFDDFITVAKDFPLSDYESVRVANYSLSSSQDEVINRSDVSVWDIEISDKYAQLVSSGNVYKTDAKAMVLLKNFGPNIVDSVKLNCFVSNATFCGDIVNSAYFTDLNLASGDSVWVDFGWIGERTESYPTGGIYRTFCIYSSNPNGIVDLNISNDEACNLEFFGFVGLEDTKTIDFSIYPNPSNETVNIETPSEFVGKIHICDQLGRTILSQRLTGPISLSEFKQGVYFVSLEDENGNLSPTKKLVRN